MAVLSATTRRRPAINLMLALIVAAASVPVLYGMVISDARCAITLDICHPLQSANSPAAASLAPPAARAIASALPESRGGFTAFVPAVLSRPMDEPDPPPPK